MSALPHRKLAGTDLNVSPLGLGTVKFGRNSGVKYPVGFQIPSMSELAKLLDTAKALGINLLDTAPAYGDSEEKLGKLLKGQRQDWVLCTKAGEEFVDGKSRYDFSPAAIRSSVQRSLRRLNTDVIDIVLIHSDGNDEQIIHRSDSLGTLEDIKKEGLIRAFGMSTKTVTGGLLAAERSDCVMATYNLAQREEETVLDYCAAHNKGVLLKKVLASGHLEKLGENPADPLMESMQFVFSHPAVSSAIIGTINLEHLQTNAQAACAALKIKSKR